MCGIFGIVYATPQPLGEVLTGAARRLAYRGYDSVGAATVSADGVVDLRKEVGRVDEVAERLRFAELAGLRGIAQLRWATFGAPSVANAQPTSIRTATWSAPTTATSSTTPSCAASSSPRG